MGLETRPSDSQFVPLCLLTTGPCRTKEKLRNENSEAWDEGEGQGAYKQVLNGIFQNFARLIQQFDRSSLLAI